MQIKNLRVLQIFILSVLLISCESIIPASKMFSCKVNGKLWEPITPGPFGGRLTSNATLYKKNKTFVVYGSSEDCFIGLGIKFPFNSELELNKKYPIDLELIENGANASFTLTTGNTVKQDYKVKAKSGYIIITKMDTQYFSGSFEFDLEKEILSKTYKIRKGQFNNMLYGKNDN